MKGATKFMNPRVAVLILLCLLSTQGWGEEGVWQQVHDKMTASTGYSLQLDYTGPEGEFHFNYTVHGDGDKILTEVLEGSSRGVGTRIYYDPAKDSENVAMQTSFFRLRRSLQARDIKDSPVHRPLFKHLLSLLHQAEPTEVRLLTPERRVLRFGESKSDYDSLEVDLEGNPLVLRRVEAGKEVTCLTFRQLQWGEQPISWEE